MADQRKRRKRRVFLLSSVLSFLLSVLLTFASYLSGVYVGGLNPAFILDDLNKSGYYESVQKYFYDTAESLTLPSGLPTEVTEGIAPLEYVYQEVQNYVNACFKNQDYSFSLKTMEDKLNANIEAYLEEENLVLTAEQQQNKTDYIKMITDEFVQDAKVPFLHYFVKIKDIGVKVMKIALPALLVLSAVCIFLLIRMQRFKHRGVRFITYSTIAATFMSGLPPLIALLNGFYKRINLEPEYFYLFVSTYIERALMCIAIIGAAWCVTTGILLGVIHFLKGRA